MSLKIDEILSDNQSGSELISLKALEYYKQGLIKANEAGTDEEETCNALQSDSKILIKNQPNMALLRNVSSTVTDYYKRLLKSKKAGDNIISSVLAKIDEVISGLENDTKKITSFGSRITASSNKVMTISNSMLVREILISIADQKRRFEVFCLESSPPQEGKGFAEFLADHGIKTTLIADSQAGVFVQKMNLVLLGADRIYQDGFINKSGSLALCLAAKHFDVPVYLAAKTKKILLESERAVKFFPQDSAEIYNGKNKHLHSQNIYYEKIPLELIHKVICEDGVFESFEFINWYLKE